MAQGLRALLEDEPDIELVGTAGDLETAQRLLADNSIDVVLCDIVLRGERDGLRLLSEAARRKHAPAFIMFSAYRRPDYYRQAVELGAAGFLNKMVSIEQLSRAVRAVAAGGSAFPPAALRAARSALPRPSARQLEVIALVAEGYRNEEIARRLGLQPKTVEGQLRRLFDQCGVNNRTGLVRTAEREGWIQAPGETGRWEEVAGN
jgi:two-component system response regulator DesR